MNNQALVDAIVKQTTILIAQLSTAGGAHGPVPQSCPDSAERNGTPRGFDSPAPPPDSAAFFRSLEECLYATARSGPAGPELRLAAWETHTELLRAHRERSELAWSRATARLGFEQHATVRVVWRHHLLVRVSHWLNVPVLLGLVLSGMSIYWASPVFQHQADPRTGIFEPFADVGIWLCANVPGMHDYESPPDWVYNHLSLGPGLLAPALRIHWLCAYLFMLNGLIYVVGLVAGGGFRSLLPRPTDIRGAWSMVRYYVGLPFARLARRPWPHPQFDTKYNALQRAAYFSVPLAALLSVATGWALHKPATSLAGRTQNRPSMSTRLATATPTSCRSILPRPAMSRRC